MSALRTFTANCRACLEEVRFDVPVEEFGNAIAFECPHCGRRGYTPGVSPQEIAYATYEMNREFGVIEEMVAAIGDLEFESEPEPDPVKKKSWWRFW